MDEFKLKQFVAGKLRDGVKLTDIQTLLVEEFECKMTFLELRLLAAELEDVDWSQFDPQEKKSAEKDAAPAAVPGAAPETAGEIADEMAAGSGDAEDVPPPAEGAGTTKVELSRLSRPGALAHGTVTFASGGSAEWLIDEMGRLGLDKVSGQPTEDDLVEFQTELRKIFERR